MCFKSSIVCNNSKMLQKIITCLTTVKLFEGVTFVRKHYSPSNLFLWLILSQINKIDVDENRATVEKCYIKGFDDAVVNLYLELTRNKSFLKLKGRSFAFQSRKFATIELCIKEIHNTVLILKNNTFLSRPGLKIMLHWRKIEEFAIVRSPLTVKFRCLNRLDQYCHGNEVKCLFDSPAIRICQ